MWGGHFFDQEKFFCHNFSESQLEFLVSLKSWDRDTSKYAIFVERQPIYHLVQTSKLFHLFKFLKSGL